MLDYTSGRRMHKLFDQIVKRIGSRILEVGGEVATQHEVAPDARAVDLWFRPGPGHAAVRERQGALGRMTDRDSILEPFHDTPGLDDVRGCVHKQLSLDILRLAEARRNKGPRPPFPFLWVFSPGRPKTVIDEYALTPMPGFPEGFHTRREADALGVVVLREVPRTRDTLLLRLMGGGAVFGEAVAELVRLPEDAWERQVALPELVALRIELPQDPRDDEEREFMMSTQDLYEHWKQHYLDEGERKGREEEARGMFLSVYRSRFGEVPVEIAAAIKSTHDVSTLRRWVAVIVTASPDEIARAVGAERGEG